MLSEHIFSFIVVISVQLLFFIFHAYKVGELSNVKKYLIKGMLLGLPFGIAFDLLIGKYVGIYSYTFGFDWVFLTFNGLFSFGFMVANVFLLTHHSLKHLYLWSAGLGVAYEVTNYFFPVWEWTFGTSSMEYVVVIFAAYAGLAATMMTSIRILYRFHFRLIPF